MVMRWRGDRVMVCISRGAGGGTGPRDMNLHSVDVIDFGQKTGFEDYSESLGRAKLLFIRKKSGNAFEAMIVDKGNQEATRAFLARGGIIWFDTMTVHGGMKNTREFLQSVGVEMPARAEGAHKDFVVNPASKSKFLLTPNKQSEGTRGWQSWSSWSGSLEVLMQTAEEPVEAGLLLADKVAGAGGVFFTCALDPWAAGRGQMLNPLIGNVLYHAFGSLPAPGETHAVYDEYELRDPLANTTHLVNAKKVEWHVADAAYRKIVLVSEPIGMARVSACVEFDWKLPAGIEIGTVRAFNARGVELHAQVLETGRFAVSMPLRGYDDQLLYVYAGGSGVAAARDYTMFEMSRPEEGWLLRNDQFEALVGVKRPALWRLRPYGGSRNTLMTWGNTERWLGNGTDFSIWNKPEQRYMDTRTEVVADGPVIKRVRYTTEMIGDKGEQIVEISLVRGAKALFFKLYSEKADSRGLETGWSPGDSLTHDSLWYEAEDGLKRLPLIMRQSTRGRVSKYAKETWYALGDSVADEVCGSFTERDSSGGFGFRYFSHGIHGQMINQDFEFTPAGHSGGWVAAKGGPEAVRDAYIAWRNGPVVTLGAEQAREDMPPLIIPKFGKQFLRTFGSFRRHRNKGEFDPWAETAISIVREVGGNSPQMGNRIRGSQDFIDLMAEGHRRGMNVGLKANTRRMGCTIENRQKHLDAARFVAEFGADNYYLLDEFSHRCYSDVCKAAFKAKTGLEMPNKPDLSKLPDEAMYQLMHWNCDTLTTLVRQMHDIVQAKNPDAVTWVCTAPGQMYAEMESFNDLETWSEFIGTTASDLYTPDYAAVRFGLQYIRGAQGGGGGGGGNDKPVFTVAGNCYGSPQQNDINLAAHLMNGSNGFWWFSLNFQIHGRDLMAPVVQQLEIMRDTGWEDVLAVARPVKYAAVLNDHSSMWDSLRRGQMKGNRTMQNYYLERQASLRNIPIDIVVASHLAEDLDKYKVLVVPSGRDFSEISVRTVEQWVRSGGKVIIEGEALLTEAWARLCGVQPMDKDTAIKVGQVEGSSGALAGLTVSANGHTMPLKAAQAVVLASNNGQAVVTR